MQDSETTPLLMEGANDMEDASLSDTEALITDDTQAPVVTPQDGTTLVEMRRRTEDRLEAKRLRDELGDEDFNF